MVTSTVQFINYDQNSRVLLGVWDCQGALLTGDGDGVRNHILSFDMTASGSNGANPAPLNPPRILLVVAEALKAA
jgi:hypothetical protein